MSAQLIAAVAIIIASSAAFLIVSSLYHWNVTAPGYGRWMRIVGVVSVLGLAGTVAWSRAHDALTAAGIMLVGVALSVSYVLLHRRLTERVRESFQLPGEGS